MLDLPSADKEQCGAFIRDERVLVVWSDSLDNIIPTCHDFEERLIKLLWRSRPAVGSTLSASGHGSVSGSVSGHSNSGSPSAAQPSRLSAMLGSNNMGSVSQASLADPEKGIGGGSGGKTTKTVRTWYGRKRTITVDPDAPDDRPTRQFAPFYNGVAAGLSMCKHCGLGPLSVRSRCLQSSWPTVSRSWSRSTCSTVTPSGSRSARSCLCSSLCRSSSRFRSSRT
jgi:hypothetical protein